MIEYRKHQNQFASVEAERVLTMEFHEKLQKLRKQKGLTQEELAERLYVSRTAVSKWESGRGYPSIDSLKTIAQCFGVTVDELLSGEELLTVAKENQLQKERSFRDLVFGLLDLCAAMLLFLPIFADRRGDAVESISLWLLETLQPYMRIAFLTAVLSVSVFGILTLTLQNYQANFWIKHKYKCSLVLSVVAGLLFVLSLQPYPAVLIFALMGVKLLVLIPKRQ